MNKTKIKKSYDIEAIKWNQLSTPEREFYHLNKFLFQLIKKYKKKTILDVGCGSGLHSLYFAKKGFKVTGIDFSREMIKQAKINCKSYNVKLVLGDINKTKFYKKFDVLWVCSSLHNMNKKDLIKTLKILYSLLESRGILAITMRKGSFQGIKIRNKIERFYRYSTPKEIKSLLMKYPLKYEYTTNATWLNKPYFTIYFTHKS